MVKKVRHIRIMAYIMLFAILVNLFSSFIPENAVFANEISSYTTSPAVAGGNGFSIVLAPNGTVFGAGKNQFGQLGGGTITTPIPNFSQIKAISAGTDHAVALKADGTVWAWGKNNQNQVGDGTTTNRSIPTQVAGLTEIIAIVANGDHSLVLKADGTVWAWGKNDKGQLGDGTTTNRSTPVQVTDITNAVSIAAGSQHSLAVKSDGTVRTWGLNDSGRLGDGTTTDRRTPVQVSGLTGVVAVSGGKDHSLALKSDGTIWAWGKNGSGQLGDGTTTARTSPVQISGLSQVIKIATWGDHALALTVSGTVWAWGNNGSGRLGDGTTTNRTSPVQVTNLNTVEAIATGNDHSLAIKADETLWAWGNNGDGRLGDGTTTNRTIPVQSSLATIAKSNNANLINLTISQGVLSPAFSSSIVDYRVTVTDSVYGIDMIATLADLNASMKINGISQISGRVCTIDLDEGENIVDILVRAEDGITEKNYIITVDRIISDGEDIEAPVNPIEPEPDSEPDRGDSNSNDPPPEEVLLGKNANLADILMSYGDLMPTFDNRVTEYNLAVDHDRNTIDVTAWLEDSNASMKLNGINLSNGMPRMLELNIGENIVTIQVTAEDGSTKKTYRVTINRKKGIQDPMGDRIQVAAGNNHSLGLKGDGTVWAWGNNENGRLGDGTTANSNTPVQVSNLTDVIAVAAGNGHSIALKADGTVWSWGKNDKGQLGDGTTVQKSTPVQVTSLTNVIAITAGHTHTLALKADGTLWAWGENGSGRLGDNSTSQRSTPVQVRKGVTDSSDAFLQGVVAIAAGKEHSVALREDGRVYTWGKGENGMLGNGSSSGSNTPVQVNNLTDVIAISAQGEHTMALKSNGTLWAWGKNDKGQLGDNTTTNRTSPVQVSGVTDIRKIAAGNNFSVVLKADGTVWAWGNNEKGQVGDGTTTQRNTSVQVLKGSSESTNQYLQDIVDISAGNNYVLAVKFNNTVWAWGDNGNGRLGDGTATNQSTPVMNLLMGNHEDLPEEPNEPLVEDIELEGDYWLPENLSTFQINLEFNLLKDILGLLDPKYIPQEPGEDAEEPGEDTEEPGEDTEEPGEDAEEPGEESQTPNSPSGKKKTSDHGDKMASNPARENQLVEITGSKNSQHGRINSHVLKDVINQMKDKTAIQVEIPKSNAKTVLELDADALSILMENKTIFIVNDGEASYVIPHDLAVLEKMSWEKGSIQGLRITMERISLTSMDTMGYKIIGSPVGFMMEAVFANETVEVKYFENQYVERRIVLDRAVDPRKCVGVVWENNDWKPVPTTFIQENGKTVAVIKRNGNSIYAVIEHEKTFEDIHSHWAKSNIELLASKKVVKGMEEGKFIPNNNVTRAQFVTMLIGSLGYKADDVAIKPFKDVQANSWYEKHVYAAMKLGIVTGYEDGTFKPDKEITREEMAVMISKTVQVLKELDRSTTSTRIADRDQVSPWAQLATDVAIELGIMKGYADQSFKPKNKATRAEAVTVFKNMMEYLDFITY
ncbi:S-layer homology domain-containing protein [Geosporobacter ferrireducens]|uniref:RCC1 domain-containing protein n=1 Tax=Geosporobacter ferrireducens TaxID=1424294 RepID=UPI00139CAFE7|nr:S-layer homology domain-containing protein [Geosporobacter ferrireducens]MTI55396.1 hypothetical protein [Geosporobacter ferrireducens]